ncbi:OmpH family outer membrane protein [Spartinivicinus poritis]|uniref:OmpH family outer membrane protein n=1 Tax=Spartinivicinus poritis TaxID=2994640 RepID=A0ABT5U1Z8_9GAMM|nr:OmpH family outer membrane protein [Spartinivicinus sp. A2-2]MDE1460391.1 OmpH family outer membrane protein [Spartinivicinus sp. A2-2]
MVKKLIGMVFAGFVFASLAPVTMAEVKVAVVDYQKALNQSDAAKKYLKQLESKFSGKVNNLKRLEADAKRINTKLKKDAAAMSNTERGKLQLELKRKAEDYQIQTKEFQAEKNKADREQFKKLKPKLDKAITEVAKANGYDLVLNRATAFYINPKHDITLKVIQKLNTYR